MGVLDQSNQNIISTAWIEKLALEELNMDQTGEVNLNEHLDPKLFLEEASIDFMNETRDLFEIYIDKFNEYRGENGSDNGIRIFKISKTINDFMLFRNSLRMLLTRKTNSLIQISLLSNGKDLYSPRNNDQISLSTHQHEIKAHVGPFSDVTWRYQGEPFTIEALVHFYLCEFIRLSAR